MHGGGGVCMCVWSKREVEIEIINYYAPHNYGRVKVLNLGTSTLNGFGPESRQVIHEFNLYNAYTWKEVRSI